MLPGLASVDLVASLTYLSAIAVGSSEATNGRSAASAMPNGIVAMGINARPRETVLKTRRRDSSMTGFICFSFDPASKCVQALRQRGGLVFFNQDPSSSITTLVT